MSTATIERTRTLGNDEPYCAPRARVRWEDGVEIREVPEYPDYWAGEDGSIWSSRSLGGRGMNRKPGWTRMTPWASHNGYLNVKVICNGARRTVAAQRLVLLAFEGARPDGMECCHGEDPTRTNIAASNLSWGTRSENLKEKFTSGRDSNKGERNSRAKFTSKDVREIRGLYETSSCTQAHIARIYGVSKTTVFNIVSKRRWSHVV